MASRRPLARESVNDSSVVLLFKHFVTYVILAATFELLFAEHIAPILMALIMAHIFMSIQNAGTSSETRLVLCKTPHRQRRFTTSPVSASKDHGMANAILLASSPSIYMQFLAATPLQMAIFAITQCPRGAVVSFIASTSTIYPTTSNAEGVIRTCMAALILAFDGPTKLLYERSQLQEPRIYCVTTSFDMPVNIPSFNSALMLHPGDAWRQSMLRYQEKRKAAKSLRFIVAVKAETTSRIHKSRAVSIAKSLSNLPNNFLHNLYFDVVIPRITKTGYTLKDSIWAVPVQLPDKFLRNIYLDLVIPRITKTGYTLKDSIWAVPVQLPDKFLRNIYLDLVIPRITKTGYTLKDSIWAVPVQLPDKFLRNIYLDLVIPRITRTGYGLKDSIWAVPAEVPSEFLHNMYLDVVIPLITKRGCGLRDSIWAVPVQLPANFLHKVYIDIVIPRITKRGYGLKDSIWAVSVVPAVDPITQPAAPSIDSPRAPNASFTPCSPTASPAETLSFHSSRKTETIEIMHHIAGDSSVIHNVETKPNMTSTVRDLSSTNTTRRSSPPSSPDSGSRSDSEITSNTSGSTRSSDSTTAGFSVGYSLVVAMPQKSQRRIPLPLRRKRSISEIDNGETPEVWTDRSGNVMMDDRGEPDCEPSPEKRSRFYYLRRLSPRL